VLFIHGDDDRNVYFTQTVDLVARLRARNVEIEQLIFPDEIHDFLLHKDWLAAYQTTPISSTANSTAANHPPKPRSTDTPADAPVLHRTRRSFLDAERLRITCSTAQQKPLTRAFIAGTAKNAIRSTSRFASKLEASRPKRSATRPTPIPSPRSERSGQLALNAENLLPSTQMAPHQSSKNSIDSSPVAAAIPRQKHSTPFCSKSVQRACAAWQSLPEFNYQEETRVSSAASPNQPII